MSCVRYLYVTSQYFVMYANYFIFCTGHDCFCMSPNACLLAMVLKISTCLHCWRPLMKISSVGMLHLPFSVWRWSGAAFTSLQPSLPFRLYRQVAQDQSHVPSLQVQHTWRRWSCVAWRNMASNIRLAAYYMTNLACSPKAIDLCREDTM